MKPQASREAIENWLREGGWYPERDESTEADRLIRWRVDDSARQGFPLEPFERAVRFLHTFALLELAVPQAPERKFVVNPAVGYEGDAELISELSSDLAQKLFPVGYETVENGLVLIDEIGRFFYLHFTGPYFLGIDEAQALSSIMNGDQGPAEDYYV